MSLAHKLWKIGSVLCEEEIKEVIQTDGTLSNGEQPSYVNLDFTINRDKILSLEIRPEAISKTKMFFSKKIGGAGSGIYYLYPNLQLKLTEKDTIKDKLSLLVYTIKNSVLGFANEENRTLSQFILDFLNDNSDHPALKALEEITVGDYWFWLSINGRTFFELMPEIWTNWYKSPVTKLDEAATGYDAFTNKETLVGYRPEVKIFSYDQYHDSLNFRVKENLPLSLESARNIKFAWIYILDKLVFFYKGLEYVIIPNLLSNDRDAYGTILKRLVRANQATINKSGQLKDLRNNENAIKKDLDKLNKKRAKQKNDSELVVVFDKLDEQHKAVMEEIEAVDTGFIREFNEQADHLGDLKNSVTLDFIFVALHRTNPSFEVKGSIEDVIPSRLAHLVDIMRDKQYGIEDNTFSDMKDREKTHLKNYFNRDELYFVANKSHLKNKNRILQERLHLARLLLTDEKITMGDLLQRFEFHREYDYDHKKRTNKGVKDWINYPETYTVHENKMINFLNVINKIKE